MKASSLLILLLISFSLSLKTQGTLEFDDNSEENDDSLKSLYEELDKLNDDYGTKLSVTVYPMTGKNPYYRYSDRSYISASMIKLLILTKFMEDIDNKKISLTQIYTLRKEDIVGGAGSLQYRPVGSKVKYDELALLMIKESDNTATNVLIDILGMAAINDKSARLGLKCAKLNRKMMKPGTENFICGVDILFILKGIYNKNIASKAMCEKANNYLLVNTDNEGIAKGLPAGIKYAHKTGSLTNIRHDGGIVYAKNPYIIVVLTTQLGEGNANKLMKDISSQAYHKINP